MSIGPDAQRFTMTIPEGQVVTVSWLDRGHALIHAEERGPGVHVLAVWPGAWYYQIAQRAVAGA